MNSAIAATAFPLLLALSPAAHATQAPAVPPPIVGPALIQLVHEGHGGATQASGVVNAVDAGQRKVTLSHGAIKSLGWPAMTMEFPVNKEIDLNAVKAGMKVNFTLVKATSGAWTVDTLKPAAQP